MTEVAAAWVQAAGALLTIVLTGGFAIYEMMSRGATKREEKRINYSIALDIYKDSVEQLDGYFTYDIDMRHVAKTIVKSNVELIQQIAFKDLPSNGAAKDMFKMRLFIISIHAAMEREDGRFESVALADELRADAIAFRDQPRNDNGPLFDL